ncbi:MAG: DUF1232 domain-containing protein [Bacteroidetes bacterium]|nr:MAG: DUF1232 domain-containing protein [Bacteroidota bacterium]
MKNPFRKFIPPLPEWQLLNHIGGLARQAGLKAVYSALLLFYAFKRKDTPGWAKNIILGTLGYLLTPFDSIPDLTPFLGFTDDLGVLSFGLVTIACYINDEVRIQARKKLREWFGDFELHELKEVEKVL